MTALLNTLIISPYCSMLPRILKPGGFISLSCDDIVWLRTWLFFCCLCFILCFWLGGSFSAPPEWTSGWGFPRAAKSGKVSQIPTDTPTLSRPLASVLTLNRHRVVNPSASQPNVCCSLGVPEDRVEKHRFRQIKTMKKSRTASSVY